MKDGKISVAAIVGIVFGGLGLLLSAVPIINNFAFALAVVGLVLGIVALVGVKKGKRTGKGLAIATIVVSALALVVVLVTQQMYGAALNEVSKELNDTVDRSTGKKTDQLLGKEVEVDVGSFKTATDEYGLVTTSLPVKVTNKLSEKKSYSIQLEVVDDKGARLADDYVYANDLGPKQSQDFKAFQYVEESKLEAVKKGTFKIVSVSQV